MSSKPRFKRTKRLFARGKNYSRAVVNADEIQSHWGNIRDMATGLFNKKDGSGREETFDNAMMRMQLSEKNLAAAYKFHVSRFYVFAVGLVIGIGIMLATVIQEAVMPTMAALGFCAAMSALCFQASFRALQLQKRELVEVAFWARNPIYWIPVSWTLPPAPRQRASTSLSMIRNNKPARKP